MNAYMWNLKNGSDEPSCRARCSGGADIEDRLTDMHRRRRGGGTNRESVMETHTSPHKKQLASGNWLYDSELKLGSVTS